MSPLFLTVYLSGGVSLALIVLFRYERAHHTRVFAGLREMIDDAVAGVMGWLTNSLQQMTGQSVRQSARQTLHFVFHQILTILLKVIQYAERMLHKIAQFNKKRANSRPVTESSSHLAVLADHKQRTQLSEVEKQQRRDRALMGL